VGDIRQVQQQPAASMQRLVYEPVFRLLPEVNPGTRQLIFKEYTGFRA
jgi:hypothetical protein